MATNILLVIFMARLEMRVRKMLRGNKLNNIEETIISSLKDIKILDDSQKSNEKEIEKIKKELKNKLNTTETIRFNPFGDVGGKQSFATAFLDDNGNGTVISSLYSREKVSVFGKPVKKYNSEYELTIEEKEAITGIQNSQK